MRHLITGSSGFAGRHLARQLAEHGHEVIALDRAGRLVDGAAAALAADLADLDEATAAVARAAPDGIFHLAAPQTSVGRSWDDPAASAAGNATTAVNVLEAARRLARPPRVLLVSSSEVVGAVGDEELPVAEDRPANPDSPYALGKAMSEAAARFYAARLELPVLVVRAFNHVGPGQREPFVVPTVARQIAALERRGGGAVRVGNVAARRDFTDVRDMVAAYETLMAAGEPGRVYNAGSGRMHSVGELLQTMAGMATVPVTVTQDPHLARPSDAPALVADCPRLRALGWRPEIPIEQSLRDALEEARRAADGGP